MNTNFKIYAFMTLVLSAITFAGSTFAIAQNPREIRTVSTETNRNSAMPGVVVAANQQSYQIGKDFALAIDDAKYMKVDADSFNFTVIDLVYLIDELEGQPEATQLQSILKSAVRRSKDLSLLSQEFSAVSNAYFNRQNAEKKWYFNVGTAQMNLLIAGWNVDGAGASKYTKDLQGLSKTAPQGTPQIVLEAIKGLSKYAAIAALTTDDFKALVEDAKLITTLVYA